MGPEPPRYVSVIGQSECDAEMAALGEELGELLAQRGCVVICGGMGGVIALGGQWGTLSEIGLARSIGRRVVLLHSWGLVPNEGELSGVVAAQTPAEAVGLALAKER